MIPRSHITAWRASAPWISDAQVEQDLIISRMLVDLFRDSPIKNKLAFRGGTALHKLFLAPAVRYSEDIDLVQINAEPIGPVLDVIRKRFDAMLGTPKWDQKAGTVTLYYRTESEIPPTMPLRIKVEINTREHFTAFGYKKHRFKLESHWESGECEITTYQLEGLLGTKLRALYQRRKGRDLLDLWLGLTAGKADGEKIVKAFKKYIAEDGLKISKKEFQLNLKQKISNTSFLGDTNGLLRPDIVYDPQQAYNVVQKSLVDLL